MYWIIYCKQSPYINVESIWICFSYYSRKKTHKKWGMSICAMFPIPQNGNLRLLLNYIKGVCKRRTILREAKLWCTMYNILATLKQMLFTIVWTRRSPQKISSICGCLLALIIVWLYNCMKVYILKNASKYKKIKDLREAVTTYTLVTLQFSSVTEKCKVKCERK